MKIFTFLRIEQKKFHFFHFLGWGESIHIAKDTAALDAIYKIYNQDFQTK